MNGFFDRSYQSKNIFISKMKTEMCIHQIQKWLSLFPDNRKIGMSKFRLFLVDLLKRNKRINAYQ